MSATLLGSAIAVKRSKSSPGKSATGRKSGAQRKTARFKSATLAAALILTLCFAQRSTAEAATIQVNTTQPGVTSGQCPLQEAIYASEFKQNKAISSADPLTYYTTGCTAGTGDDTIVLASGAVFTFDHSWDGDPQNIYGPTATPLISSKITIEGNGATLQWLDSFSPGNSRLFVIAAAPDPNIVAPGIGKLTLKNVYIKGFHIKGGMAVWVVVGAVWARGARSMSVVVVNSPSKRAPSRTTERLAVTGVATVAQAAALK